MDWADWQLVNGSNIHFCSFQIEEYAVEIIDWVYTVKMYVLCVGLMKKL